MEIQRIGIFHFNGYTNSEMIKFNKFIIKNHKLSNINEKDVINIHEGEIHFWNMKID